MSDLVVNLKKIIHAPQQKVFDAWLDAKKLSRFMTPMPGMPEPRVEADGREGGKFVIYMVVGEDVIPHKGTFLEVSPYTKLVFSWESPFSVPGSTVTILFKALSDSKTELTFTHVKFKGEQERSDHEGGWTQILKMLDTITAVSGQRETA